eukprot:TRINITY_DN2485_c0_g1_i2.p1 TRINITY_DN2485_c0_g1~~TRINITY_DN2485_c0_g1_i2.p1  ORF type:complete len:316 (+),score=81.24 TRINITY_DN2485_c0_g1_i2:32-949(+)
MATQGQYNNTQGQNTGAQGQNYGQNGSGQMPPNAMNQGSTPYNSLQYPSTQPGQGMMPPQGMQPGMMQGMPPNNMGRNMPPQGMQPGMMQGMPPTGMQGMPPQPGMMQGMPPQGMPFNQGMMPPQPGMMQGMPPQGMQGMPPQPSMMQGMPPQGMQFNQGMMPPQPGMQGMPPSGMIQMQGMPPMMGVPPPLQMLPHQMPGFMPSQGFGVIGMAQPQTVIYMQDRTAQANMVFDRFDRNGNGSLSIKEWKHALDYLGYPCTHHQARHLFHMIDINRSGSINRFEFVQWWNNFEPTSFTYPQVLLG